MRRAAGLESEDREANGVRAMTDENDTHASRGTIDGEEQEVEPFRQNFGIRASETFEDSDGFAVVGLSREGGGGRDSGTGSSFHLGGSGDDRLESNGVNLVYMGGSGDDTINAMGRHAIARGGSGDDTILGTLGNDWLIGDAGDDSIVGSGGNDFVAGCDGNDLLYGGGGDDWVIGGAGDDRMSGGDGRDLFHFHAENGDDTIFDFRGNADVIDLRAFDARITWAELSASIATAENGQDAVIDLSAWGGGTITLRNVKAAYLSEDMFCLPNPQSSLEEGDEEEGFYVPGTATFVGSPGADTLVAGGRDDFVFGGEGDDTFDGGAGNDWIFGGEGVDTLDGNAGNDRLIGGEGRDTLEGGAGTDTLTGGAGADTFAYHAGDGSDTITDFSDGEDKVDLSALEAISGFEELSMVQLGSFVTIDLHGHGGRTIALENVDIEDLDETDFVFYQPPAADPAQDGL